MDTNRVDNWKRQLQRMVKDEEGRQLLSQVFGMQFSSEDRSKLPTVAVLIPSYGTPKPECQVAWEQMIAEARKVANVHRPYLFGHSIIHWVRNEMIAKLYQDDVPFTHVLFIDDDIEPAPDGLVRMLSHGKDIVGALCTRRADPPIPTLRIFDEESGDFVQRFQWKQGGLIEVDALGTGMILISKQALDTIANLYLKCGYESYAAEWASKQLDVPHAPYEAGSPCAVQALRQRQYKETKDQRWSKNGLWFQTLPAVNGCGEYGEDISFCLKARIAGIPVYCDTNVTPLHHGDYGYGIGDFFAHKRNIIEEAKRRGEYRDPLQADPVIKKDSRKLSVVVPVFNKLELTQQCLKNLIENTAAKLQVVFVDDGSTDGTREWIKDAAKSKGDGVPEIRYCFHEENHGVNAAWNSGVKLSTGDYIAVVNNDILFAPGWDQPLLDALEKRADIGVVSPFSTFGPEIPRDWPHGTQRGPNPVQTCPILGCCFAFRRDLIEKTGLIPEGMRHFYGDDWIAWAARQKGLGCSYATNSYIHHLLCQTTKDIPWQEQLVRDQKVYREMTGITSPLPGDV
jgi:GT2 family glycosyltransferase